jgi:hypothetical protein
MVIVLTRLVNGRSLYPDSLIITRRLAIHIPNFLATPGDLTRSVLIDLPRREKGRVF